jgi:hypothetical protein
MGEERSREQYLQDPEHDVHNVTFRPLQHVE